MNVEWGQGRAEIVAARDEIVAAISGGCSIKSIYTEMKSAKRVSLTYGGFYRHVRKIRDSSKKPAPAPWGQGRMEAIASRSEIRAGIAKGRTLKAVYSELKADGRVTVTYRAFHMNVRKFCGSPRPQASSPLSAVPSSDTSALPSKLPAISTPPANSSPSAPLLEGEPEISHPYQSAAAEFVIHELSEEELM